MTCPSLATRAISPHPIRHTTATHLLQSGVDITVIAMWLGHEATSTTRLYVEADLAMRVKFPRFRGQVTACGRKSLAPRAAPARGDRARRAALDGLRRSKLSPSA